MTVFILNKTNMPATYGWGMTSAVWSWGGEVKEECKKTPIQILSFTSHCCANHFHLEQRTALTRRWLRLTTLSYLHSFTH